MVNREIKTMELIRQGKNNKEICNILKIDLRDLKNILISLKNKGVLYNKKYTLEGNTLYIPNKDLDGDTYKDIDILLSKNSFKSILISDLHLGTKEERLDLLNLVYEYASKEGIHLIINGGDLINGLTKERKNITQTMMEQCFYFIEKHPFDKNILNICVLGNHDIKCLTKEGINFKYLLETNRLDFAISGVGEGRINLKKDSIYMYHPLSCEENNLPWKRFILVGHSHHYKIKIYKENVAIFIPALSNYVPESIGIIPSFLVMETYLNKNFIESIRLENLTFNDNKITHLGVQELELKRVLRRG